MCGIETFCLDSDLFSSGNLQTKKSHIFHQDLYKKSNYLAQSVHKGILHNSQKESYDLKNRTIRHGVSQVLLGSCMPSILIEVGFISNKKEAQQLQTKSYQQTIAQGICNGITNFLKAKS